MFVVAPHAFLDLVLVVCYDAVRCLDDGLGGPVVLFQADELIVGVVVFEVQDVLYVGTAEAVDRLGVVAHHADVLEEGGQTADDEVLCEVGVLVLVHKDVLEVVLVLVEDVGVVAEQHVGEEEDVVEVHRIGTLQAVVIHLEDLGDEGLVGLAVGLLDDGVVGVVLGRVEARLGGGDACLDVFGGIHLGVELHLLEYLVDERL